MGRFFSWGYFLEVFPRILSSLPVTLGITASAFSLAFVFACGIAAVRIYKTPVLNQLAVFYISFIRGTPILVQLLIINLALPGFIWSVTGVNVGRLWPPISFVIIAYAVNSAAFLAETLRSAVTGVDAGQNEAAVSVGMTRPQAFLHVVFPQALRIAMPQISNSLASLVRDTSLAYAAAGTLDVMGMAKATGAASFRYFEGYVATGILFFALCILVERGCGLLSRMLDYGQGYRGAT